MAKSAQRRRRQYHSLGDVLFGGGPGLSRLPRQLHARRLAGLARRRCLPDRQRQLADTAAQAAEIELIALSSVTADSLALRGALFIPTLKWPAGAGRGRPENSCGVVGGCVIPIKSWAWIAKRAQARSRTPTAGSPKNCILTLTRTTPTRP